MTTTTIPFEPRRFRSTAAFYARYRVPYPDEFVAMVARRVGLRPGDAVLDLGCGPGLLAIAFARIGMKVTAMDPEPEMLAAGEDAAREAGVSVTFRHGSSYDLGTDAAHVMLTVMGRSFHWMDRPATLSALDALTERGGGVALFHDRKIATDPDWANVLDELSESFSPNRQEHRRLRRGPEWVPHEAVLLHSAFGRVERLGLICERHITTGDIVGRAYSMSVTSPEALGARQAEYEAALRSELLKLSPAGTFTEIVEISALIGFREGKSPS